MRGSNTRLIPIAPRLSRCRVKIVFPTVAQLLEYRKLSALAAPDVVALGTLNFGSLEDPDALVVVVAPSPEDEEEVRNTRGNFRGLQVV